MHSRLSLTHKIPEIRQLPVPAHLGEICLLKITTPRKLVQRSAKSGFEMICLGAIRVADVVYRLENPLSVSEEV